MRRGWALWVLALAAVAGVVLGLSGYVMAGSFTQSARCYRLVFL